jgi:hypothetical protein
MFSGSEWLWIIGCLSVIALLAFVSHLPFYSRLVKLLGGPDPDYPKPALGEGETLLLEGQVIFTKGMHGAGRVGRLVLTNRRIIWYEDAAYITWPFKRYSGELNLLEIASVDQGIAFAWVFGGRRLWLRLRSGKGKAFWVDGLDEWVRAIQMAVAGAQ